MVANRIKSCPELTSYFLIEKPIKKSVSFEEFIKIHKYTSKSHSKSYGTFLQNNPNATRIQRINAIVRFLKSIY